MDELVRGASTIVHLGAISAEDEVDKIFHSNFRGTFNLFDGARRHGVRRIVFASSVHAVGYYRVTDRLDSSACPKPDTMYGVSKAYGEELGKFYSAKFGLEVACMRIGSVEPAPRDVRHLSTWLSFDDMVRLVSSCLDAPALSFTIVYGASDNTRSWWDNTKSGVDYRPQDNAEAFAEAILRNTEPPDPADPVNQYQGGFCVKLDVGERAIR
jgi:uronate dehydrogenase